MIASQENNSLIVLIVAYNRPDFLSDRLQNALDAGIKNLFVSVDFLDLQTTGCMKQIIEEFTEIWPIKYKISARYHTVNQGLSNHITESVSELLEIYREIIVIEDDISFSSTTIQSLEYGLIEMRKDSRIASVGCYSGVPIPRRFQIKNKFRLSPYFACWGWATSSVVWQNYTKEISLELIESELSKSKLWSNLNSSRKSTWRGRFKKVSRNSDYTWDIQFQYMCFKNEMLNLLPLFPIVENLGFNDIRSSHTNSRKPYWMVGDTGVSNQIFKVTYNRILKRIIDEIESLTLFGDNQKMISLLRQLFGITLRLRKGISSK